MKTKLKTLTLGMVIALAITSCENNNSNIVPSQYITSEFVDISGYSELELNDAFEAEINFSDTEEPIEIIANENLHQYIQIVKTQDKLRVYIQDDISISGHSKLKVILTTAYLTGYTANDASLIGLVDALYEDDVTVYLGDASQMTGSMYIQNLSANIRDASLLELSGEIADLSLTASDASRMGGLSLHCLNLAADLSDASKAELSVNGKINITASGASELKYKGDASIESQNLSGASAIIKVD